MTAQQGLVGRDDVLAVLEGGGEYLGCGMLAADQLDDDVDGGVVDDGHGVVRQHALGELHAAVGRHVEVRHLAQDDVDAGALGQGAAVVEEAGGNAGADGAEAQDPDADLPLVLLSAVVGVLHG